MSGKQEGERLKYAYYRVRTGHEKPTLGARGFSCVASGVGHVSIVTVREKNPLVPRVWKTWKVLEL